MLTVQYDKGQNLTQLFVLKTRLEQTWEIIKYGLSYFCTSFKNILEEFFSDYKIFTPVVQSKTETDEILKFFGYVEVHVTNENKTNNLKLYLINNDNFSLSFGRD